MKAVKMCFISWPFFKLIEYDPILCNNVNNTVLEIQQLTCTLFRFFLAPGPCRSLVATSEKDVTKPRSITIGWQRPSLRDLNGIITEYFIRYELYDEVDTNVGNQLEFHNRSSVLYNRLIIDK